MGKLQTITKYDKLNKIYVVKTDAPQGEIIQRLGRYEHGPMSAEWIGTSHGDYDGVPVYDDWRCSQCDYQASDRDTPPVFKFCPMCGRVIVGTNPEVQDA